MQQKVATFIHKHALLRPGDRIGVAVSGGADSVALFRILLDLMPELGIVLAIAHFNHLLRGPESDADEHFVAELAHQHQIEYFSDRGDAADFSREKRLSIESAARTLRYKFFADLLGNGRAGRIATGHTLDDQAETVLLKLARGAGTRGLAGIYPEKYEEVEGGRSRCGATIVRPLLGVRRSELELYLKDLNQPWREDSSNQDFRMARNRVRHRVLPVMERELNPSIRENLAETAEIARDEETYWETLVAESLPLVWDRQHQGLDLIELRGMPRALQRRVIRAVAAQHRFSLESKHVADILAVVSGETDAASLPRDWRAERERDYLRFIAPRPVGEQDYDYLLPVPGRIEVPEAAACFEASLVPRGGEGYNPNDLHSNDLVSEQYARAELRVRNWRAGDSFWPAHAKSPKKVKELLQERHITGAERKLWPVVASGDELLWLRGFSARGPEHKHGENANGARALLIREIPLKNKL